MTSQINPPPRQLMGPGPINADPRVLRAMSAPLVGQYDPAMTAYMNETMELFRERIGKPKMSHVPYKGSGPAMTDLVAGRIPCMFDAASVVAPFVKSGQLKALMATGPKRIPAFPEVPTATERGIKDFQVISFIGMYGPPGLPADIVKKVNTATNAALQDPKVQKTIADRGDEPGGGTPEELGAMTRDNYKLLGEVVKKNGLAAAYLIWNGSISPL